MRKTSRHLARLILRGNHIAITHGSDLQVRDKRADEGAFSKITAIEKALNTTTLPLFLKLYATSTAGSFPVFD
jgi:hypothetical protein